MQISVIIHSFSESMKIITSFEDECRLCDDIIEFLSDEVLHVSFCHISGRQVASGNFRAIGDFIELFSELFTIVNKSKDTQTRGTYVLVGFSNCIPRVRCKGILSLV